MTELKDGIKKIIQSGFVFKNIDSLIDDLAQRIADSLVVDEEKVTEIVAQAWCTKENENKEIDVVLGDTIIKAIAEAKPIKCEVVS